MLGIPGPRLAAPVGAMLLHAVALAQGGLPPVPVPAGNPITPQKAILGKLLFWEEQLSADNRVACGTCHRPEAGGGDPRRARHPGADGVLLTADDTFGSPGIVASDASNAYRPGGVFAFGEQVTGRNSPAFLTAAWFTESFWDGRAGSQFADPESGLVSLPSGGALENQAVAPPRSPIEMAHDLRSWGQIEQKLQNARPMALATGLPADMAAAIAVNTTYPALFQAAFGDPAITADRIARAIATYERTLVADQTPWDRFQQGVTSALTSAQQSGLAVFNGQGRCNLCHPPGLFSDGQFRNLGLRPIAEDVGRQAVTGNIADRGKWKVPSLRNVGLRASLMHTGEFQSLGEVVTFYRSGGGPNLDNKDPLLVPVNLLPIRVQELTDFLQNGLTDPRVQNRQFPFDRPTLLSERMPATGFVYGTGSAGSGGIVPAVLAAVPANVGNSEFKIGLAQAVGGAPAVLLVAAATASAGATLFGANLNVDPTTGIALLFALAQGPVGAPGQGFTTVLQALPADPALAGITLFAQWGVVDSGIAAGFASSRGAELRFF